MSKIVKPRLNGEFSGTQKPLEIAVQCDRFQRAAGRIREGEIAILPFQAREQSLLGLLRATSFERPDYAFRDGNNAPTAFRFHFCHLKLTADTLERLVHPYRAALEVDIRPSQAENFAATKSEGERKHHDRFETFAARNLQELPRTVGINHVGFWPRDSRRVD